MHTTTKDELESVMRRAHAAYLEARAVSPGVRASWLGAVADALDSRAEELVPLAHEESRLPDGRLRGELGRTTFQLRLLAQEVIRGELLDATLDHADDAWGMGPRPDIRRVNVPLGVVGVFGASNFPFAFSVMGGDSAAGLAAGCAVVHKVHEAHPALGLRTAEIVVDALRAAGAPDGLFAAVTGREIGNDLVDHPLTAAIGFTGSTRVGRMLMERAQARPVPIPFYGELGSINPVFVTPAAWDARRDQIAREYVGSFTLGSGQFCTKPGLLLVPSLEEEAAATLRDAVAEVAAAPMLSERLASGFVDARDEMASREGVATVAPGGRGEAPAPALLSAPVEAVLSDPAILREEMFGPASIVVTYEDVAQLEKVVDLLEGQLTASVHAEEGEDVSDLLAALERVSGRLIWNAWPTGVTVTYAQHHGGPFPATTSPGSTSVGTAAPRRFTRPVAYQGVPDSHLPPALQEANPWRITRRVDGVWQVP
ncbi:aldehyde dehydrogenase (NADP(+)) [Actinotalea caeni]|uniref:aldehyde dehydrogenase (NADP(+)) n=1 Tax=Actinotalea caeni TaxID=1348467 RepID=UPI0023DA59C8|nr:aldehyde dehydrogenase (NADP(+)) [Actinotalea caeni]